MNVTKTESTAPDTTMTVVAGITEEIVKQFLLHATPSRAQLILQLVKSASLLNAGVRKCFVHPNW